MFIERIKENFKSDEPIFTKEILNLFPEYSRAQVFRLIKKSVLNEELIPFTRGTYSLPVETPFGTMIDTSIDEIAYKRYVNSNDNVYGIISGLMLLNRFHITTQVPVTWHIVTNNESTRSREIIIDWRKFILHKSRVQITSENYAEYTVLQLFTDFDPSDELDYYSRKTLLKYINKHNITKEKLISMMEHFPSKTIKRVIRSKILDEIA